MDVAGGLGGGRGKCCLEKKCRSSGILLSEALFSSYTTHIYVNLNLLGIRFLVEHFYGF